MKLGISSYTYGWAVGVEDHPPTSPMTELDLLQLAVELGVSLVQIGDNLPLHTFEPARLKKFAASAKQLGMEIELGARGLTVDRVSTYLEIAKTLNSNLIRFVVDDVDYHPTPEEIILTLRTCAPMLGGKLLALENHDRFKAETLRQMIERAGSDQIGVCLDTANSLGAGEGIDAVLPVLAPSVLNLHIKDFHIERLPYLMGFTVHGRPAGQGFLNVSRLLQTLKTHKRCQSAILELWTPWQSTLEKTILLEREWAVQSMQFLRPLFD
jgi:sugar phosphate isomerase/epimerase